MKVNDFSILIGGEAGAGIARSGFLFAKACMRGGLHVFCTIDYQSLIRGGHNFYIARISGEEVYSQLDHVNLIVALNAETVMLHKKDLSSNGGIIYDSADISPDSQNLQQEKLKLYSIPLKKIVRDKLKETQLVIRNTVALGAVFSLLKYDLIFIEGIIKDIFKPKVAEINLKAVRAGFEFAEEHFEKNFEYRLRKIENAEKRIFLNGNEAIGLGAIKAGCKFYAAYPMTPSTGLLHFMAANERKQNMIVIQPEGEIAAINMAIGAAFAGVRAMTATSGGGFCLMSEGLGMAGMTEMPIVINVAQRQGPSTGLPTYSAQADLRFILHASQGEFPRIVIAPGDIEECFYETMHAFNWAEKYQLPVINLTDKYLLESYTSIKPFNAKRVKIERGSIITGIYKGDEKYKRYEITANGVSPRALPLTKRAIVRTSANEHDEYGFTTENPEMTTKMIDKRIRKLVYLSRELEERNIATTKFYGPARGREATLISWGSTKGPILEAIKLLNRENIVVNYLQIIYLQPFPKNKVENVLDKAKKTIIVENNKNLPAIKSYS
jgi:2-oxoglutarate ferredoxin oxidoreductase subunit alpha